MDNVEKHNNSINIPSSQTLDLIYITSMDLVYEYIWSYEIWKC
jgi:hypothetical protein